MKIIENAIRFPVTTAVGVILLVLFGVIGFFRLPIQLTPSVEEPDVTVTTVWTSRKSSSRVSRGLPRWKAPAQTASGRSP